MGREMTLCLLCPCPDVEMADQRLGLVQRCAASRTNSVFPGHSPGTSPCLLATGWGLEVEGWGLGLGAGDAVVARF